MRTDPLGDDSCRTKITGHCPSPGGAACPDAWPAREDRQWHARSRRGARQCHSERCLPLLPPEPRGRIPAPSRSRAPWSTSASRMRLSVSSGGGGSRHQPRSYLVHQARQPVATPRTVHRNTPGADAQPCGLGIRWPVRQEAVYPRARSQAIRVAHGMRRAWKAFDPATAKFSLVGVGVQQGSHRISGNGGDFP